jgi:hypothetical protein
MQEERILHEAKLAKMEAEMKMVFQQKVQEKEAKLKQSEEELYARHKEMKDALDKQRGDLEDKKRKIESGRPLTPEKASVRSTHLRWRIVLTNLCADWQEEPLPPHVDPRKCTLSALPGYLSLTISMSLLLCRLVTPSCILPYSAVHFVLNRREHVPHSFAWIYHGYLLSMIL